MTIKPISAGYIPGFCVAWIIQTLDTAEYFSSFGQVNNLLPRPTGQLGPLQVSCRERAWRVAVQFQGSAIPYSYSHYDLKHYGLGF